MNSRYFLGPMVFGAMAGGMAWGIRGQYGHETGAMIAGLLLSLTLLLLLKPNATPSQLARAVAIATLAMGLGGSMTYGQTLGLTHDPELVGNVAAWRWGMLGVAIKGGVWIGFAGAFLGLALGGVRYRPGEMAVLTLGLVAAYFVGRFFLNSPFDPSEKILPALYFSGDWHWQPDKVDLRPRPEAWGGLWFALATLLAYTRFVKRDFLAGRMGLWGILGGALGFPAGQAIQSYHSWHLESFTGGIWTKLAPHMNWWNMMEITFGAVMAATLGLGLWLNRKRIAFADEPKDMPHLLAIMLLIAHVALLFFVEFRSVRIIDTYYDLGLIMIVIPMILCVGWRAYPFLQIFLITLMPIAGKTVRQLVYREETIAVLPGWILYGLIPLSIGLAASVWAIRLPTTQDAGRRFIARTLMIAAWSYFLLNWAFFHFPWPWTDWTGRTPSGIIYIVCLLSLTALVARTGMQRKSDTVVEN